MATKQSSGYRARFEAAIAALEAHPDVALTWRWIGESATPVAVRAAGDKLGWKMTDEEVAFYTAMNGVTVAWMSKHDLAFDPKVHKLRTSKPTPIDHEKLGSMLGIFAFLPITDMARKPLDYAVLNGTGASRIAFELPGNYYTPALSFTKQGAKVQVGDDHGAAWDGPACSFIDYVETVLATWGILESRKQIFGDTKRRKLGRTKPVALASLLPATTPSVDDKAVRALFKKANRTFGKDLTDAELVTMIQALPCDEKIQNLFQMRLSEASQTRRALLAAHTPALVGRLDPAKPEASLAHVIMQIGGAFSPSERMKLLRIATDNDLRGSVAAAGGAAMLPELTALWNAGAVRERLAIVHAAIHLGAAASPLAKLFEKQLVPKVADFADPDVYFDEDEELAYGCALALVALDPKRADKLVPHLRVALRTDVVRRSGRPLIDAGVFTRLPAKAQTQLAAALAEIALAAYTSQDQLAVFFALGEVGMASVLRVVETKSDDYETGKRIASIRSDLAYAPEVEKLPAKLRKRFATLTRTAMS